MAVIRSTTNPGGGAKRLSAGVYETTGPARRPSPRPQQGGMYPMNTGQDLINTGWQVANQSQRYGNQFTNPNQFNPFGSQQVTFGPDGSPIVTQGLSQGNQNVVSGVQGSAQDALSALRGLLGPGAFGSLSAGGEGAPQSNYEASVFKQLTRGLDEERKRATEDEMSALYSRGVGANSEGFSRAMSDLNKRFDERTDMARAGAVTQGHNQLLGSMGALSQIGQGGFYNPSFQPFQSTPYAQPDVQSIFGAITSRDIANAQLRKSGGGRSGGGTPAPPKFNIVAPPGS